MAYDHKAQDDLDQKHLHDPQPGDYWSEVLTPVFVVLDVSDDCVIACGKIVDAGNNKWTWNLSLPVLEYEIYTRQEFVNYLSYSSAALKHKTWASVSPGKQEWAVQEWKKIHGMSVRDLYR